MGKSLWIPFLDFGQDALVILARCFVPGSVVTQPAQPREKQLWYQSKLQTSRKRVQNSKARLCLAPEQLVALPSVPTQVLFSFLKLERLLVGLGCAPKGLWLLTEAFYPFLCKMS